MDAVKKMDLKLQKKDDKGALSAANALIDEDYASIDGHIEAYLAYQGMKDNVHAKQQKDIAVALLRSILSSGKGTRPESAYTVICVREEYNVLSALGLKPQSQSLMEKGG